jgi:hypothetical protein
VDLTAFARVTAPSFVGQPTELPLDELRAKRREAQLVDDALSYLRRLVQGRLEIVEAELGRRDAGLPPSTVDELVRTLSETLGDHDQRSAGARRTPVRFDAPEDPSLTAELDAVLDPAELGGLAERSDTDLALRLAGLSDLERTVSGRRRQVLDVLDALGAELARRYGSGEASVDSLLS